MPLSLIAADGTVTALPEGTTMVVGRAATSDLPIVDPTISRRHAELHVGADDVTVVDLGSSNGTFVNGERIERAEVRAGDVLMFGKVPLTVRPVAIAAVAADAEPKLAPGTVVRQVLKGTSFGVPMARSTPDAGTAVVDAVTTMPSTSASAQLHERLMTLVEVAKALGRASSIDALLEDVVRCTDQILSVDRVTILLADDQGELVPRITRDKRGGAEPRPVPRSIANKALADRVAIMSDDAGGDDRFGGQSIQMQQIRSVICCPLIGSEDRAVGVLYVDNAFTTHRFGEEDLELCIAFAGVAGVAIEREQLMQRVQKELLVRSNFERYFAPRLAERIAASSGATRLGGEKRAVAVLFSDIRGFTALSETMRPDDMASLLTEYFTEMVDCVFRNDGTLDKFIGDAVMAQWGAPIGDAGDPDRAMIAAREMIESLDRLNARWADEGRPQLQIGIGVNYGEAFAGNIGSERRLEFTVIGDTVNTASRLCGAAGPREILVSQAFRDALTDPPPMTPCPPMELKNKSQPITVYRVDV